MKIGFLEMYRVFYDDSLRISESNKKDLQSGKFAKIKFSSM